MMLKVTQVALATVIAAAASGCAFTAASEEDIGTVDSALVDESKDAEKDAREAEKDAEKDARDLWKADRKARRLEGFEEQQVGSSPNEFSWFTKAATSYYTVTDEIAYRGKHSMRLVSPPNAKHRDARIGTKICAEAGSATALSVIFRARITGDDPLGWSYFGISDSLDLAAFWWIVPDGTVTDGRNTYGKVEKNNWTRIRVDFDLANDLVTISIDGVAVATQISSKWKPFGKPVSCLRLAAAWQTLTVDQVWVQPESSAP